MLLFTLSWKCARIFIYRWSKGWQGKQNTETPDWPPTPSHTPHHHHKKKALLPDIWYLKYSITPLCANLFSKKFSPHYKVGIQWKRANCIRRFLLTLERGASVESDLQKGNGGVPCSSVQILKISPEILTSNGLSVSVKHAGHSTVMRHRIWEVKVLRTRLYFCLRLGAP